MPTLEIRTFGGLDVTLAGATIATFEARSAAALLVYLAHADGPVPREVLAHMLWPDRPRETALANLRSAAHRLKRVVSDHLHVTRGALELSGAWTDGRALEGLLRGRSPADAVALYRGDFLDGFVLDGSPAFESWLTEEAERYRALVVATLQELVLTARAAGGVDDAIEYGHRLLRIDPLHEPTHRAIARALARSGRRAAALAQIEACVTTIHAELGFEADPATLQLAAAIRDGTFADDDSEVEAEQAASIAGGPGGALRLAADAGRVTSIGEPTSAPDSVRTATGGRHVESAWRSRPNDHGLPTYAGPLVGRDAEMAFVARLLRGPDCRWLTILGPGGVGKTRLAVTAATTLAGAFADGVRFLGLTGVREPRHVMAALATALHLDPLPPGDARGHVEAYLRDKQILLVVDNLEHLTDAAPLIADVHRRAPAVRVLATSRTRLHLSEEWLLVLDGLADAADAERLFNAHAARASAQWDAEENAVTVREICALVENMPLALELAATWSNALPPERIAASLRSQATLLRAPRADVPERHRSLAAAFDTSWQLLPEHLRSVLAGLAVFRGGFTTDEAARVAFASEDDLLALVDRSLVRARGNLRFDLHELIRQYAQSHLAARDEVEPASRRHLHAYLEVARTTGQALLGSDLERGLARLHAEADNVRAALAWGLDRGEDAEAALALVEELTPYWRLTCAVDEARTWLTRADRWLARVPHRAPAMRSALGHFAWMAGDIEEAEELLSGTVGAWNRTSAYGRVGRATTLVSLGMTEWSQGNFERATLRFGDALGTLDDTDPPWWRAIALGWLGKTAAARGDLDAASRHLEASLAWFERIGNPWGMGLFVAIAAELHLLRGDLDEARRLGRAAAEHLEQVGFKHALGPVYALLAIAAVRAGSEEESVRFAERAMATYRELGDAASAESLAGLLAPSVQPGTP